MHHRYDSWKSEIKQRRYLEQFALKFGISKPQDWGKVAKEDLIQFGGSGLVKRYGNSIRRILTNIYQGFTHNYLNEKKSNGSKNGSEPIEVTFKTK